MTTQPKQLTYRETIEQELRASRRLRDKRLCSGPYYLDGACCAIGAFNAHAKRREPIEPTEIGALAYIFGLFGSVKPPRFLGNNVARGQIINANENFRYNDNSPEAQRARYAYMVQWCLDKLAEPQSVSA